MVAVGRAEGPHSKVSRIFNPQLAAVRANGNVCGRTTVPGARPDSRRAEAECITWIDPKPPARAAVGTRRRLSSSGPRAAMKVE